MNYCCVCTLLHLCNTTCVCICVFFHNRTPVVPLKRNQETTVGPTDSPRCVCVCVCVCACIRNSVPECLCAKVN